MVAKINDCLSNNFWPELWIGPNYPAWHRTDDGLAFYMGTRGTDKGVYWDSVQRLLQSDVGNIAAVLLAYTCFSVLKSFFPQYHSLDASTPYLQVKKYLPQQLGLSIRGHRKDMVETLVDLCCGYFKSDKLGKIPILDGIDIPTNPSGKRAMMLTSREYEARVLQPASVLWVHREPTRELLNSGGILSLTLPANASGVQIEPFIQKLLEDFTQKITENSFNALQITWEQDWEESASVLEELVNDVLKSAGKYFLSFSDLNLREELQELKRGPYPKAKLIARCLWAKINREIQDYYDEILELPLQHWKEAEAKVSAFADESKKLFSDVQRAIQKNHKQNQTRNFTFDPIYSKIRNELGTDPNFSDLDKAVIQKLAFLSAAYYIFLRFCAPKVEQAKLHAQLNYALARAWKLQINEQAHRAGTLLEKYLQLCIHAGQCARIRGKDSDKENIKTWYNPITREFLLPSKTYFFHLQQMLPNDIQYTRRTWEKMLVDEGILRVVQRGQQARRSCEIKVGAQNPHISVIKVDANRFSEKFFTDATVHRALTKMEAEKTPLRTLSDSL